MTYEGIWIFNGVKSTYPSAVFINYEKAVMWIKENKLTGTLTKYPMNISVYDWAIENNFFKPKKEEQKSPEFIGRFTSAALEHYHFEDGGND